MPRNQGEYVAFVADGHGPVAEQMPWQTSSGQKCVISFAVSTPFPGALAVSIAASQSAGRLSTRSRSWGTGSRPMSIDRGQSLPVVKIGLLCPMGPMRPIGLRNYLAQAYASTRGSAPALRTPVFGSMAMAAFEPNDHAPVGCNL